MRKLVRLKLKILAKLILKKYKPKIIGITGSVGKTSAKEAVFTVLKGKFSVRRNTKNYNNEIGLPLTIIGSDSPGKSMFGWLGVFIKACGLILWRDKNYPKILVLEMGVDRPGDMKYLISIAKADIGIVTLISHSHEEFFTDVKAIQKEKGLLVENLKPGGWAILNFDDDLTKELAEKSKVKVLSYGFKEGPTVRAQELVFSFEKTKEVDNLLGISFKLTYNGSFIPVLLPQVIGYNSIYAALAAAAIGIAMEMNLVEISKAMREFDSPNGRMNLIDGIKHTLVIDDTYNSSPASVMSALDIVTKIPLAKGAKRFAVLGDMLELGGYSEEGHKEVGRYVAKSGINKLITVGERSRDIARAAEEAGMSRDDIFEYTDVAEAGRFIEQRIEQGDLVLVKGSQGLRLEKIVKEIMAEPLRAKELLVRQEEEWSNNS
ncbi:MAG: Mur ligase family protein [Patescibacteria group bacterium]|nr:Mur ligase family protein [Patescibacteria group bacterium]